MNHLQDLISYIERELPGVKIFLFGSRVNNKARKNSDYDIALDWNGKRIPLFIMSKISNYAESLPILVDIIDFNAVDSLFKEYVLGEKIICLNDNKGKFIF